MFFYMKSLTEKEVLTRLKEIGIDIPTELSCCLKEYEDYLNLKGDKPGFSDDEISSNE